MLLVSIESKACIITIDFLSDLGSKINFSHPFLSINRLSHDFYRNINCSRLMVGLDLIWVKIFRVVEGRSGFASISVEAEQSLVRTRLPKDCSGTCLAEYPTVIH